MIKKKPKAPAAPKSINQAARILALAKLESESRFVDLTPSQRLIKNIVGMVALVTISFLIFVVGFSQLFHLTNQHNLRTVFREQLAAGTAPTGEVDFENTLLKQGAPVAIIRIPSIGVDEVVVEGTDSGTLTLGPGHRRDTVMPGQVGTAVLMGRAAAYGGPFAKIQSLAVGAKIEFITGQGQSEYEVLGVRNQGDYLLPQIQQGEGRLLLLTAKGPAFIPTGVTRLDAKLVSQASPTGVVLSNIYNMPKEEREMGFDLRYSWALVFALQLLLVVILAAIWSRRNFTTAQVYLVFTPLLLFSSILVFDQTIKVLPNLL